MSWDAEFERIALEIQRRLDEGLPLDEDELRAAYPAYRKEIDEFLRVDREIRRLSRGGPLSGCVLAGDFRLLREIGQGGMGRVFEAEQLSLGRRVAVKLLMGLSLASRSTRERFEREGRTAASLEHPNIVRIFGCGHDPKGNVAFIAMELVDGVPLSRVLRELGEIGHAKIREHDILRTVSPSGSEGKNRSGIPVLCGWIVQVAGALDHAHALGVIHRDVKPGNILLRRDGVPMLTDFGLARLEGGATVTGTGEVVGSPAYMSPEQILAGKRLIDKRTDVYSLGVTLYECLTLRRPFDAGSGPQLTRRILEEEPTRPSAINPRIPKELETITLKAMEKDPSRRYASAAELAADLERFLRYEPIRARPPGLGTRIAHYARRNRPLLAAIRIPLILVLGALLIWFVGARIHVHREIRQAKKEADGHLESARRKLKKEGGESVSMDLAKALREADKIRGRDPHSDVPRTICEKIRKIGKDLLDRYDGLLLKEIPDLEESIAGEEAEYLLGRLGLRMPEDLEKDRRVLASKLAREDTVYHDSLQAYSLGAVYDPKFLGGRDLQSLANVHLRRWRLAEARGLKDEMKRLEEIIVGLVTKDSTQWREIHSPGRLSVTTEPPGARVYLFRYVELSKVIAGARSDRLVPVPCDASKGFEPIYGSPPGILSPGEIALVVEGARGDLGIEPGDLISRIDGHAIGDTVYRWRRGSGEEPAPLRESFDRIAEGDGRSLDFAVPVAGFEIAAPEEMLNLDPVCTRPLKLEGIRDGRPFPPCTIPTGVRPGLRVWTTSCPLIQREECMVARAPFGPIEVPPGSYLLLLRADGYEDLRYPVVVRRKKKDDDTSLYVTLNRAGTTPPGFVYVPRFDAVLGGDPLAPVSLPRRVLKVGPFFMARDETSYADYIEFVRSDMALAMLEKIPEFGGAPEERESRRYYLLPRRADSVNIWKGVAPEYYQRLTIDIHADGTLEKFLRPWMGVRSVCLWHAELYCDWRTALEAPLGRRYRLPSEEEWEAAARGADGRAFPWGERFDWGFAAGYHSTRQRGTKAPGCWYPVDESPFGIRSLAGGAACEWCSRPATGTPVLRGGSLAHDDSNRFRTAAREHEGPGQVFGQTSGFRICFDPPERSPAPAPARGR